MDTNFNPSEDPAPARNSRRKLGLQLYLRELGTYDEYGLAQRGISVRKVLPNEAGYFAGIKDDDFIIEIDNIPVQNLKGITPDLLEAFTSFVRSTAIGEVIQLKIRRGEETHLVKIQL